MNQIAHPLPIVNAFREGWTQTRANLRAFVTLGLVNLLLAAAHQSALGSEPGQSARPLLGLGVQVVQLCVWLVYVRFALAVCDGREIRALVDAKLLRGFLPFVGTGLLFGLIVGVGLLLLVVPGVIWGLRYCFATMVAADQDRDPIAALRESARLTQGVKLPLLGFAALCVVLNGLGAALFGVGLVLTLPVTFIAQARVLRHLQAAARQHASTETQSSPTTAPIPA